ncbi:hypothetical protein [Paraburkholderia caribensis]|uniref:hypothetical protein n=1 Tax=Paraburkholderia caribensis TaxID=75105 RepID=UPI0034D39173
MYGTGPLSVQDAEALIAEFLSAKFNGTDLPDGSRRLGLFWKPVRRKTVKRYLAALNAFDKWQQTFHDSRRLNPSELHVMNAWEIYSEFVRRTKWDPMLHLYPAKSKQEEKFAIDVPHYHKRFSSSARALPKAFPLNRFVDLVESCKNPRDKMIYLQMFGLALRESEPLHLYTEDIFGASIIGEARIRLDDPETGGWEWQDKDHPRKACRPVLFSNSKNALEGRHLDVPVGADCRPKGSRGKTLIQQAHANR